MINFTDVAKMLEVCESITFSKISVPDYSEGKVIRKIVNNKVVEEPFVEVHYTANIRNKKVGVGSTIEEAWNDAIL